MTGERSTARAGWALPGNHAPVWCTGLARARAAMALVVGTRPGEHPTEPTFGCDIHGLRFAPATPTTAVAACEAVQRALVRWVRAAEVIGVDAVFTGPRDLEVRVSFRLRGDAQVHHTALRPWSTP
jgi:phage baseplate assembly protein W